MGARRAAGSNPNTTYKSYKGIREEREPLNLRLSLFPFHTMEYAMLCSAPRAVSTICVEFCMDTRNENSIWFLGQAQVHFIYIQKSYNISNITTVAQACVLKSLQSYYRKREQGDPHVDLFSQPPPVAGHTSLMTYDTLRLLSCTARDHQPRSTCETDK